MPGRLEVGIAKAACATAGSNKLLVILEHIDDKLTGLGILYHRTLRYPQDDTIALGALFVGARTVFSAIRLITAVIAHIVQG